MRTLLTIALCLLLASACTDPADLTLPPCTGQRGIAFGAYTAQPTRSGALRRSNMRYAAEQGIPAGESIGVYAYYHDDSRWSASAQPNFMWNQKATSNDMGESMGYEPLKYWPNDENDKLSFMAYYPYCEGAPGDPADPANPAGLLPQLAATGTGLPTFAFTVQDDADEQVDFLVSQLMPNMPQSRDTDDDPGQPFNDLSITDRVHFYFQHMTSKVEFHIVADPDIRKDIDHFHLNSLRITNIYTDGTLTPAYDDGEGTTFSWSNHTTTHDYPVSTTEPLLLMPQTLRSDARIEIDYEVAFKSDSTVYTYDSDGNAVTHDPYTYANHSGSLQLNTMRISGTGTPLTEWLPNHHYVYTIRLCAQRIDFTAEVVYWGESKFIIDELKWD